MKVKINVTAYQNYIIINKNIRGKILEIDSRKPNTMYMQYGYTNGVGPWHSTSAIQYAPGRYGYDTPDIWPKSVKKVMPEMFEFMNSYVAIKV
jgi:hypothetical protein